MTMSRVFAILALLMLGIFCGILIRFVPRVDLGMALLIGFGLAAFDVWDQLFREPQAKR